MKKRLFIILLVYSIYGIVKGQNLVPNYSFENFTTCPVTFSELNLATPWFMPLNTGTATSDLLNACNSSYVNVPSNTCGYQAAHTGSGYAGIFTYGGDCREYIEVRLSSPLIAGNIYNVEMYVNPSNLSGIAGDAMGIYISMDSIAGSGTYLPLPYTPQISNPSGNIITDTAEWTLVSGSYTSLGGENYITIGSFLNDSNTHSVVYVSPGWARGYYYIDDVSVTENATTGIKHTKSKEEISIYPNPTSDQFFIDANTTDKLNVDLYNVNGGHVFNASVMDKENINLEMLDNGTYMLTIKTTDRIINKKLVILR